MSCGTLFASITGPNGSMLAMANHEKLEVINGIINIAVFIAGAFVFLFLESTGLALATFVAVILVNIIKLIEICIVYRTNPYPVKLIIHLSLLIIISSLAFFFVDFISNIYVKVCVDAIVGIALIVLSFIINPNKTDKYFFSNRVQ